MKINRVTLLAALKLAAPALSSNKNQVMELTHFWFDGEYLSAYDDLIGVRVAFETDFKGGVIGEKLIGVLENSRAKEVTLTVEDDENLLLKAGRALITFALRPIEDWFWNPEVPEGKSYKVTKEFISAIELALISVGSAKIQNPEQRGITIIQNGEATDFYSTDAASISWMQIPKQKVKILPPELNNRCILPTQFCEHFLKIAKPDSELCFDEGAAYLFQTIKLGDDYLAQVMLFSKLVEEDEQIPFQAVVEEYIQGAGSFPIPSRFRLALDRALVLLEANQTTDFSIKDGNLYLYAETPHGKIDDEIELKDVKDHPDIKVQVDSMLIKRGVEGRQEMTITKECVIMTGPAGFYHMVATK